MQLLKSTHYFAFILILLLSSCGKCPILSKLCGSKQKSASTTAFEITDARIGAGDKDISEGRIVFDANEKIIITFDVRNFTTLTENWLNNSGITYYWIREDLMVRDKKGAIVMLQPAVIDGRQPTYTKPLKFKNSFTLSKIDGVKPGRYTVTLLATDLIGFQTATTTIPIKIK